MLWCKVGLLVIVIIVVAIIACATFLPRQSGRASSAGLPTIPFVSTRGHFDLNSGELIKDKHNTTDYTVEDVQGLENGTNCPPEAAIFVHGLWASAGESVEQTDRTRLSLETDHYRIPVIGYTWDSDTAFSLFDPSVSKRGWDVAKRIADENGPKLARFLIDYLSACKMHAQDVKIRLIGHSLGAAVIFSCLINLNKNITWNSNGFNITSVNLLGAAGAADAPSKNTLLGLAINNTVMKFYNLYDPRDVILQETYGTIVGQNALGLKGAYSVTHPVNYIDQDVSSPKMQYQEANGTAQPDCLEEQIPVSYFGLPTDNHCGYMGFRDPSNRSSIRSDGAMGAVVADWK